MFTSLWKSQGAIFSFMSLCLLLAVRRSLLTFNSYVPL